MRHPWAELADANWCHFFDDRTLARGRAYAREDRVDDVDWVPLKGVPGWKLSGLVEGSGRHEYHCDVFMLLENGQLELDSACTCPVNWLCKHAVALLQTILGDPGKINPGTLDKEQLTRVRDHKESEKWRSWESWFEQLQQTAANERKHVAAPERQFAILLCGSKQDRLLVLPAWMRPAKAAHLKGNMVDPKPLRMDPVFGATPTPAGGWAPQEEGALNTLLRGTKTTVKNQKWIQIKTALEEQALDHLLQHYPVFFERGSNPLERGEDLAPEPAWRPHHDGSQQLVFRIPGHDDCKILDGAGCWYIDHEHDRFGRLTGHHQLLKRRQFIPPLPPEHIDEACEKLQALELTRDLPLPGSRRKGEVIQTAPVPVLDLELVPMEDIWVQRRLDAGAARLSFDYAGITIPADIMDSIVSRTVDGTVHDVIRDPEQERQWQARLHDFQLVERHHLPSFEPLTRLPSRNGRYFFLRDPATISPLPAEAWEDTLLMLEDAGFRLHFHEDFPHPELVEVEQWHAEAEQSRRGWFDVSLGIDVDGERVDMLPLLRRVLADPAFPRKAPPNEPDDAAWRVKIDDTRLIRVPLKRLRALVEPLLEWLEHDTKAKPRVHVTELDFLGHNLQWQGGEKLRQQLQALESSRKPPKLRGFKATLRPYQKDGLAWLTFLAKSGLGGVLADDMGLGKTVQVLAHLVAERQARRLPHPALVVCPTSLVGNWASEAKRFAPQLRVLVLHGPERHENFDAIADHHLVISTYPLLVRDAERWVQEEEFSLLILDEAQAIKNARSRTAQVVREIRADRALAVTGTPLENHLGELWAQFDAVEPGILGGQKRFVQRYRTPIEKHGDVERQQQLNQRIGALLLRRRKEDVLTDLPPKSETVHLLELDGRQRELYESLRLAQHERVREAIRERGLARAGIIVLDALLKLRQACCDPRLVKLKSARKVRESAKMEALLELLDGLLSEDRRILVFSQFTGMLKLIQDALDKRKVEYELLTGKTPGPQRAARVKRFQDGKVPLFLISLKAGGTGLNLTAADTVIHYDPWWNPAVEAQATDRAHRIGQDKPVFVYRLICAGTIEEKIQAMQKQKAELAKAVLEGGSSTKLRFNEDDLEALLGPG